MDDVKDAIAKIQGELIIKYYPMKSITVHALHAHIERLLSIGFEPDVILVDYADLLRPSTKSEARYQELATIYEDLRALSGHFSIPVWTASQSQRSSANDEVIEGNKVAESWGKIMTGDFIMSVSRMKSDKISNTARIHIIKNRFGPDGLTFPAYANFGIGKFDIFDEDSAEGVRIKKQMQDGENTIKKILKNKLLEFNDDDKADDLG
jgi:replicative DNA helicase